MQIMKDKKYTTDSALYSYHGKALDQLDGSASEIKLLGEESMWQSLG